MEPEGPLPYLEERAIELYPEPVKSEYYPPTYSSFSLCLSVCLSLSLSMALQTLWTLAAFSVS
jgi:hypothetical protein